MLYIVPTPIGNLKDMTYRSVETLLNVDLILAEDTRVSGRLLKHYNISTPMKAFHMHNEHQQVENLVSLLQSGKDIAMVTDAGTPGISDPGYLISKACHENNIPLTCLPGATAFVPALVASGISCDKFHFEGFLPHKKGRQTRWKYISILPVSVILYESPHRVIKCLKEIIEYCGEDRMVSVVREISKLYEEISTNKASQVLEHYEKKASIKGEIVIIIEKLEIDKKAMKKNKYQ